MSKNDAARITKHEIHVFHDEFWKPIYFGAKNSRWQGTKNKRVSVFTQNAILLLAAYVNYAGFSPLQCPTTQAMLATPGFLCRFLVADAAADRWISMHGVFAVSQTLPVWVVALLRVLASFSCYHYYYLGLLNAVCVWRENCERKTVRLMRQFHRRPYFVPPMVELVDRSWMFVSADYTSQSYKPVSHRRSFTLTTSAAGWRG